MNKRIRYGLAWAVATLLATTLGVIAVVSAGATLRGRGPLGQEVEMVPIDVTATPQPPRDAIRVRDRVSGEWGVFVVECRGTFAYGIRARGAALGGWRVVSYEKGPDDDVDAVFSNGRDSVDLEVFCNRGRPTVAELERSTLSAEDAEE